MTHNMVRVSLKHSVEAENKLFAQSARNSPAQIVDLSVVVPTYKEVENILAVVEHVSAVLDGVGWEIIFVDDNPLAPLLNYEKLGGTGVIVTDRCFV